MHPFFQQTDLRAYLRGTDIELVAYSPLAQGVVFGDETISAIATTHGVSEAVVTLTWLPSKDGVSAVPHTSS